MGNLLVENKAGAKWMTLDGFPIMVVNGTTRGQLYAHYDLSEGHCICTGLGLGVREYWLMENPKVTRITVLEKHREVIDYHADPKGLEIIHTDARQYKGECDTLLLHHTNTAISIDEVKDICKNIKCRTLWFWGVECYLRRTPMNRYAKLRNHLPQLPDLSEDKLMEYLNSFKT